MADPGLLGNDVRNWLHYDGLATTFFKQSTRSRQLRDEYEKKIIGHLHQNRMDNAIIQITNGRITVVEERIPHSLTLRSIEHLLHGYYGRKGPHAKDEAADIMNYIRSHRGGETIKKLKKTQLSQLPPLPPPSLLPNNTQGMLPGIPGNQPPS
jgi:hypothetical protein